MKFNKNLKPGLEILTKILKLKKTNFKLHVSPEEREKQMDARQ